MASATYEVAQVLERNRESLADHCANTWHQLFMNHIVIENGQYSNFISIFPI
jgi:hypothetical protein